LRFRSFVLFVFAISFVVFVVLIYAGSRRGRFIVPDPSIEFIPIGIVAELLFFPDWLFFSPFHFGRYGSRYVIFFFLIVVTKNEFIVVQVTKFNDVFIIHAVDGRCIRLNCRAFIFKNDHVVIEFDVTLIVGFQQDIFYFIFIG
jgi:hypothetical protein